MYQHNTFSPKVAKKLLPLPLLYFITGYDAVGYYPVPVIFMETSEYCSVISVFPYLLLFLIVISIHRVHKKLFCG